MPKEHIKEFKTSNKNLLVRISIRNNGALLFGKGIDATTRRPLPGCTAKLRLHTPLNTKQIPDFERMLVQKIETKYEKTSLVKSENLLSTEKGIFSAAFMSIEDKSIFHRCSWNDETFNNSITYFENQILSILDELGTDIGSEDILNLQDKLIQSAFDNKRSNSNKKDATTTVSGKMIRMDYIYQVLRDNSPSFHLPDIDLSMNNRHKKVQAEQPKALPNHMRIMLARLLFRLVETPFGGLALAAAMMFFASLRTAESAAVCFGKIIKNKKEKFATYFVEYQEKDRKITNLLKTQNAYRCVILPQILINLINKRKEYLISKGYTRDYINTLIITYDSGDPYVITRSAEVSGFVRKLLILIGCSDGYFEAIYKLMCDEPDIIDGEKNKDVTAYLLRRDWATRACNTCGLKPDQVDYLMGHANKSEMKKDYKTLDSQASMAWALERYVFDPYHSRNPAFNPIILLPGIKKSFKLNQKFLFEAGDEEIILEITVNCSESGNSPSLITSSDSIINFTRFGIQDNSESRQTRSLIGDILAQEIYNYWIDKANNIDLSKLEGR